MSKEKMYWLKPFKIIFSRYLFQAALAEEEERKTAVSDDKTSPSQHRQNQPQDDLVLISGVINEAASMAEAILVDDKLKTIDYDGAVREKLSHQRLPVNFIWFNHFKIRCSRYSSQAAIAEKKRPALCQICDDSHDAEFYCKSCEESLCTAMKISHLKAKKTKDHIVVSLNGDTETTSPKYDTTTLTASEYIASTFPDVCFVLVEHIQGSDPREREEISNRDVAVRLEVYMHYNICYYFVTIKYIGWAVWKYG